MVFCFRLIPRTGAFTKLILEITWSKLFLNSVTYPHRVRQCLPLCPPMSRGHCLNRGHRFGSRPARCPAHGKSDDAAKVVNAPWVNSVNVAQRRSKRVTYTISKGSPISSTIRLTCLGVKYFDFLSTYFLSRGLNFSHSRNSLAAVFGLCFGRYIMASSLLP